MRVWIALLMCWALMPVLTGDEDLPIVADGFTVDVIAKEPMVRNACAMAFDRLGRLCVAQGPQWRGPTPETAGDRVDILIDSDGDGIADSRKTFAQGFNSVQGIAWHGADLWVANAPEFTVVRDTDGDDEADVYIKVYTGLGNLEHSLHGLNFGPDGKLYMSKGNSKGYNRIDQLAPKAFRDLWGLPSPAGAPDYPPVTVYTKDSYQRAYHTPQDDWGQQGGILRCDPYSQAGKQATDEMGRGLEIVSRGFRNPWDICFDDGFDFLGTDNDQTEGDKVFAPFYGAHFGWGHPWSFDWKGIDHLPTVPVSMPLYEGSGAGLIHYHAKHFPAEYRDVFFVNDWMRREIYVFRPEWQGALIRHQGGEFPGRLAHADGGRSLAKGSGRVFEPTDIEVGPDGALYVLSWGHGYGATMKGQEQIDAGRVYRIRHAASELIDWKTFDRSLPLGERSLDQLFDDFSSSIPAWRVDAQNELLRRGEQAVTYLSKRLREPVTKAEQTWGLWILGRLSAEALMKLSASQSDQVNVRLQTIRILALVAPDRIDQVLALDSAEARLRHVSVQAIWQAERDDLSSALTAMVSAETDRVAFYSGWNAMAELIPEAERKALIQDPRPRVRLAALLGLFLQDKLSADEVQSLRADGDQEVAGLVELWLRKTGKGAPLITLTPPPGEYSQPLNVTAKSTLPESFLTYTTDGSTPAVTGMRVKGPIVLDQDTKLRFSIFQRRTQAGVTTTAEYTIRTTPRYRHRQSVHRFASDSGGNYQWDWGGLSEGKLHYTDRQYQILDVPESLRGLPFLRTANADDRRMTKRLMSFEIDSDMTVMVGVDVRIKQPLPWLRLGEPDGFADTGLVVKTSDPDFRVYAKSFRAGEVALGANIVQPNGSPRGNYIVILKQSNLTRPPGGPAVTVDQVAQAMNAADPARGRELFLRPQGAGCYKCHRMQGIGNVLGPDLTDIGRRAKTAEVLIDSIVHPSKVITEGFAQQRVLTIDGQVFSGAVIEETGRSIKLADSEGELTTIDKKDIEQRSGTKLSPMPDGFASMMTAQQIADLTAWLMTQKVSGDRQGFWFQESDAALQINYGKQPIATYLKDHPVLTRRALVNVHTPGGLQVTRNFPPRKPEDIDPGHANKFRIIHPNMHPGLWISFGDLNGNDYWRLTSKVVFDRYLELPSGDKNTGGFTALNRYISQDGRQVVCEETTTYRFEKVAEGLLLRIDAQYVSDQRDFYFGDQEESGLAVRVASPLRVQGGDGTIINSRGETNGAQIWGKQAEWFDYFGTIDGKQAGVMVMSSDKNPRPCWLHARDYGVIVTNPFPKQPRERREPYVKTPIKRGETYKLSFAVLLHELPAGQTLDREKAVEMLKASFR